MLTQDMQVGPLIEVFELYMLRDATLADMRKPTTVATRAMLDAGLSPEIILTVLDSAVKVAAAEMAPDGSADADSTGTARELGAQMGLWLMEAFFDPDHAGDGAPLAA